MNRLSWYIIICVVMQFAMSGCNVQDVNNESDGLKLKHILKEDSAAFDLGNNRICSVKMIINADCPEYYVNDTLTRQLQSLYVGGLLNKTDTIGIEEALLEASKVGIGKFGDMKDEILYGVVPDAQILRCVIELDIDVIPNNVEGVITFCKRETVSKDGETTIDTHHYVNIDLHTMTGIDIYNLFEETDLQDIANLLRNKLLIQSNVKKEDDLIGMGYFNLDNITANNNFYYDADGVTWNYVTYEIACYSVGETQIMLDYATLAPYITENSILFNYLKHSVK